MSPGYLFDTDAISEVLKPRPAPSYLAWLRTVPRALQFASAVAIGELYCGAHRSDVRDRHLHQIQTRVLPTVTVLPFDAEVANVYGLVTAELARRGIALADADVQIAATALRHDLALVTADLRNFERVPGLRIERALATKR